MTDPDELDDLVIRLQQAMKEFDQLLFDEEYKHDLGAPCTKTELAELERRVGRALPSTYFEFMARHNGWEKFDGDAKVLAVEDFGSDWVVKRLRDLAVLFYEAGPDPFEAGCKPVMLGEDARVFLVLDPHSPKGGGEPMFVLYDLTRRYKEFRDFKDFLRYRLDVLHQIIEDELKGESDEDDA